jgi:hypothetical protein
MGEGVTMKELLPELSITGLSRSPFTLVQALVGMESPEPLL